MLFCIKLIFYAKISEKSVLEAKNMNSCLENTETKITNAYVAKVIEETKAKNANEPEFLQGVFRL